MDLQGAGGGVWIMGAPMLGCLGTPPTLCNWPSPTGCCPLLLVGYKVRLPVGARRVRGA